eukprot:m.35361 g.35361  ORF g.35361 m.35361 type:complete len:93 (+) comp11274_c0_seq5:780-1058(+)
MKELHIIDDVLECVKTAGEKTCNIVVMGETSTGKSTFNNILLNASLFPAAERKCTARIWECVYGDNITLMVRVPKEHGKCVRHAEGGIDERG